MMRKPIFLALVATVLAFFSLPASAQQPSAQLEQALGKTYMQWRNALVSKDYRAWSQYTAKHRQVSIRNRINSERRPFPSALFNLPAAPPTLTGLQAMRVAQKGATATAVYFGPIDFGVGGNPTENLLMLSFNFEGGAWKYDKADFISLVALPEVRKQLKAGDKSYLNDPSFKPTGVVPQMPIAVGPAAFIAKVYVFSPGREVKVKVNKISDHIFQDTKAAEVVIGGGRQGLNEVQFATKALEGSKGTEALSIRVYLMSQVEGVKPVKVYEYQVNEGGAVKPYGTGHFTIDAKIQQQLMGK